jgi:hypothetical protein
VVSAAAGRNIAPMNRTMKVASFCGLLGLAVAITLSVMAFRSNISAAVLLTLWPTSIVGMVFTGPWKFSILSLLLISIEYGGNFVLYGLIGLSLIGISKLFRSRKN